MAGTGCYLEKVRHVLVVLLLCDSDEVFGDVFTFITITSLTAESRGHSVPLCSYSNANDCKGSTQAKEPTLNEE